MIWETNDMIAGCIDKMRRDACGACTKRDACADLWPKALAFMRTARSGAARRPERRAAPSVSPFFSMLGEMAKAVEAHAREHRAPAKASPFRQAVERRVEALLASGDVGIGRVARDLGCSRQTLYRRLKAEGITYEQLLDGLRRRLALRLIREQGLPVKEAAYRLGFSDPAAFSRAFKRWTGSSPGEMRRAH
jgi:AraC-like DNA-binding protein